MEEGVPFRAGCGSPEGAPAALSFLGSVFSWITWALKQCTAQHAAAASLLSYPQTVSATTQLPNPHSLVFCSLAFKSSLISRTSTEKTPGSRGLRWDTPGVLISSVPMKNPQVSVNLKHHSVSTKRNGKYSTLL